MKNCKNWGMGLIHVKPVLVFLTATFIKARLPPFHRYQETGTFQVLPGTNRKFFWKHNLQNSKVFCQFPQAGILRELGSLLEGGLELLVFCPRLYKPRLSLSQERAQRSLARVWPRRESLSLFELIFVLLLSCRYFFIYSDYNS